MTDFTSLRTAVTGAVLEPSDPGFADELSGFNLLFAHTPEAVVAATDATDIVEAVRFARNNHLAVRALATGHGSHAAITDGLVITTRRLAEVSVDADTRIATVGAGAVWSAVVAAAADVNLAPVTGSAASVGVVGYLLGGGLGPLARSHGFSSDYVRSFTVVTGEGEVVEASSDDNADLYWALRGGKGGLGIVIALQLELVSIPALYAGSIMFPTPSIEPAFRAWVDFTTTAPADVTTSVAILRFPPIEQIPAPLRGQTLLALRFAYPGSAEEGERIIAPLRAAAPAMFDQVGPLDPRDIATIHNDPTEPGKSSGGGAMLASVDQNLATTLLSIVGPDADVTVPIVAVELRHVGGATRTDVGLGSAVGGRGADYTITVIGSLMQPGIEPAFEAALAAVASAVAPWLAPSTTINFTGLLREKEVFASSWAPATYERLATVRAHYDPSGVFPYLPVTTH